MRDMGQVFFEKGVGAPPGVIDHLIGYSQTTGRQIGVDATHGGDGDDVLHTNLSQRPDVGPVIHPMGRDGMRVAMARQEDHLFAAEPPVCQRCRRLAERCRHHALANDLQTLQRSQARAPDNGQMTQINSPIETISR